MRIRPVLLLLALGLGACGGEAGDDVVVPRDGGTLDRDGGFVRDAGPRDAGPAQIDPAEAAARIAEAFCAFELRCRPTDVAFFDLDEDTCAPFAARYLETTLNTAADAVVDERLAFDPTALDACVQALEAHACVPRPRSDLCRGIFEPTRQSGEACRIDFECVEGYCDNGASGAGCSYPAVLTDIAGLLCLDAANVCATCVGYAGLRESCDGVRCGPRLGCANLGSEATPDLRCLPSDIGLGASCFTTATGYCAFGLNCVGQPGLSTCVADAEAGEPCTTTNDLPLPAPRCGAGLICTNDRCAPLTIAGVGESCDNVSRYCVLGAYCNAATCVALPGPGEPCLQNTCREAFCSGGTCQALLGDGAACGRQRPCERGLMCLGTEAEGVCGGVQWEVCD